MAQAVVQHPGVIYQFFDRMAFTSSGNSLSVEIVTQDLYIRSVKGEDLPHYKELFGAPRLFQKIEEAFVAWREVGEKVERWVRRWEDEGDPFSAFSIFKKDTHVFVGYIVSDCKEQLRTLECLVYPGENGWGYEAQAVSAFVERYLSVLKATERVVLKVRLPLS